jgi:ABC-type antimicrobial peptide transport system permease subunit
MAYLVSQGTRDIGIRIALGATQRNVLGLVLRQGTLLAAIGLTAGLAGAWVLTRFMQSLLFGVSGTDRITFAAVAAVLAIVAILATFIPARRAARIDPMVALRSD